MLVVGAGPAGSAAARALAQQGLRVVLADRHAFPRDKVCGDGLISDALGALSTLGLRERAAALAVHPDALRIVAPSGRDVRLGGDYACVPRERFDLLLWDAAREAGAIAAQRLTAVRALESDGRVCGARFTAPSGDVEIRAPVTLLAAGANAVALRAFGLEASWQPDAVAGRAYFVAPPDVAARFPSLMIAFHREWCPGYGWIFPSPGHRFNIGVGLFAGSTGGGALQRFWRFFTTSFAPAATIVGASRQTSAFRGAPLRTSLSGGLFGRPGLLAIGEAASTTYAATGEGIGKAMESGLLAAAFASECVAGLRSPDALYAEYGSEFRARFRARYRGYAVAQQWASHPRIVNVLTARARAGRFARTELEALVSEQGDPRRLFSVPGLVRALVR